MKYYQTLLIGACLLFVSTLAPAQWVDLRVPFDRLMDEGHEAYASQDYQGAAMAFRDARLLRPQSPEASMNLGLAEVRLGNYEAARERFEEARTFLGEGDPRLADSWYNEGTTWLDEAVEKMNSSDQAVRESATDLLLRAIDRFDSATKLAPNNQRVLHNRRRTQTLLDKLEEEEKEPPPPPEDGEGEGEGDGEGEDESQSSEQPAEGEDEESDDGQSGESDESQDQQDQPSDTDSQQQPDSQPEESPADADPSDGQPESEEEQEPAGAAEGQAPPERPDEMTPEEARELLNLLGNRDLMIFRQPRTSQPPPGGRDW